jgi:O-antigen/teichoic acid export membrane protein
MLFKNTLAQSASVLVGYLFSFLLAPIMIARLGLDAFGVWAVTGAFAAYAGLLDLGIGRSLSRFIAVYDAERDERRIRECVGLGLIAMTVVGLGAAAVAAAMAPFVSDQLGVLSTSDMRLVLLSSVAIWSFNGYHDVLTAVGVGKRRMVPPNVASTSGAVLNFAFSIGALAISSSLALYALANAAAAVLTVIPAFFAMRYVWERPYLALPSRALVGEVLSFSVRNQIGWIADLVNFQTDKVIIALMIDVRAAAAYEIASRVVMAVRSAAVLTVSAMIPTAAAAIVAEGRHVIGQMFRRYTLRTCGIAFPMMMLVSACPAFLLIAWLGSVPEDSILLVPVLTFAYLVNITTGVGSTITIADGHPGVVSSNSVLIAIANLVLTLALAPVLGIWGVVLGTFVSVTIGSLAFTARFLHLFKLPARDFLAGVLPTGALAAGIAAPVVVISLVVGVPEDRLSAAIWLVLATALYGLPYWVLATRFGFLPAKIEFPFLRGWTSVRSAS